MISLDLPELDPQIAEEPPNQMISLDMNDILVSNEQEALDPQLGDNVDLNTLLQNMPQDFIQPESKQKEPKVTKNRAHFNVTDFYDLRKIKYTLEFESPLKKK